MPIFFSETRPYMAIVIGTTISVIMLAFMLTMHPNRKMNPGIFGGSVAVFALAL